MDTESSRISPVVGCVVLNWNGWRDTLECLRSLARLNYKNVFITVVDNGSTDNSVARIRVEHPELAIIRTGENLGFAGGVNVGIRSAVARGAEYIWLLNNDARPCASALKEMVEKAIREPRLGAVGCVLKYLSCPGRVQAWGGGKVNCWIGRAVHATSAHDDSWFDYLTAASVLLRWRALEDIGLFDEEFFLYWEDTDLCFRLRRYRWRLGVAERAVVLHKENASTGSNRRAVDRFSTASGIRFLRKHARYPKVSVPMFLFARVAWRLARGRPSRVGDILGGMRDYWASRSNP